MAVHARVCAHACPCWCVEQRASRDPKAHQKLRHHDTDPELPSASAWRMGCVCLCVCVRAGGTLSPWQVPPLHLSRPTTICLSPPATGPFEPGVRGTERARWRESRPPGARRGGRPQDRPPPSALVPPGCPDPCPQAPPHMAFCSHHINHRPGQDRVRELSQGGHGPRGPQTEWLPVTPDGGGQGPPGPARRSARYNVVWASQGSRLAPPHGEGLAQGNRPTCVQVAHVEGRQETTPGGPKPPPPAPANSWSSSLHTTSMPRDRRVAE